jgi:hypothetical protein
VELLLDNVHEALDKISNYLQERAHAVVEVGGIRLAAGHDHSMLARLHSRHLAGHKFGPGGGPIGEVLGAIPADVEAARRV